MPDGSQGKITPIPTGWIRRAGQAVAQASARFMISNITPETWMSALQPLIPFLPEVFGRRYDYQVGRNLSYIPRGDQEISFWQLRALAKNCEILRMGIETVKDQLCALEWQIRPRDGVKMDQDDPQIKKLTAFFKSPDKRQNWYAWLRILLEELLVTDAVSIYRRKTKSGKLFSYELIDGSTIFPLIDADGYTPIAPDPAYQQILKGAVKSDLTTDELVYSPRNVRVYSPYGYPATEQVIMSATQSIERNKYQLAYFTEGSTPDTYATLGVDMPPDQILAFEQRFNAYLSGNASQRRKIPFTPKDTKLNQLKPAPLKDEFDEWIARNVCYALSLPPTAFVKQMNRATAETSKDAAREEGQGPKMLWIQHLMNDLIAHDWPELADKIEFAFLDEREQDPQVKETILASAVKTGRLTINESREMSGLEPSTEPAANELMLETATGFVPLPGSKLEAQVNDQKQKAALEMVAAKPAPVVGQTGQNPDKSGDGSAQKLLGKAVRHQPVSFRQTNRWNSHSHDHETH